MKLEWPDPVLGEIEIEIGEIQHPSRKQEAKA